MALLDNSRVNTVSGIIDPKRQKIRDFLQDAVNCWINNNKKDEWFALRHLVGGEKSNWEGTKQGVCKTVFPSSDRPRPRKRLSLDVARFRVRF